MPTSPAPRTSAAKAAPRTLERLVAIHPDAHCELGHETPFQLLVATVLSAQTTDIAVNKITPGLFRAHPDARSLARAAQGDVERLIDRIGMFRQKSKNIIGLSKALVDNHGGEVPRSMAALIALPGVGRKTANVVLGVIWGTPDGVVVDTHVGRIAQRLGWTKNADPAAIEADLSQVIDRSMWDRTSHTLIFHGRRVCFAQKPNCDGCGVNDVCPSAFRAENVGRKPPRATPRGATEPAKPARPGEPLKPGKPLKPGAPPRVTKKAERATKPTRPRVTTRG